VPLGRNFKGTGNFRGAHVHLRPEELFYTLTFQMTIIFWTSYYYGLVILLSLLIIIRKVAEISKSIFTANNSLIKQRLKMQFNHIIPSLLPRSYLL